MHRLAFYPQQQLRQQHKLTQALVFVAGACITTLGLFWLMSVLVKQDAIRTGDVIPYVHIDIVFEEWDETHNVTDRLPEPPKVMPQPPRLEAAVNDIAEDDIPGYNPGPVKFEDIDLSPTGPTMMDGGGDARPIVRIEPAYPASAARDGIEGWVRLRFSISPAGSVENIEIIDAEPKRVFDREARRALRKWKYQPKVVDGQPVAQHNMTIELAFTLQQQ